MKLWIAEKPSMAANFAGPLNLEGRKDPSAGAYISSDGETALTWLCGHLLEEYKPEDYDPQLKQWRLEPLPFIPEHRKLKPSEKTIVHFHRVKKLIDRANEIVIATDYDREGEVIGRSLLDYCGYKGKVLRVNIAGTDPKSIKKCIDECFDGERGVPLYYAGMARSAADWIIGMNFSRLCTILARQKISNIDALSAGRVQTAVLNMIVERENEIANFISTDHYRVKAQMSGVDKPFTALWHPADDILNPDGLLLDMQVANNKCIEFKGQTAIVNKCTAKDVYKKPILPLNLSTAQIECSKRYNISPPETLDILQKLYDTYSLTTYPRTQCRYLPTAMLDELPEILNSLSKMDDTIFGTVDNLDKSLRSEAWNDNKVDAHYALVPTTHSCDLSKLTENELKVYKLIRDTFLAQFLPDAKYRTVSLDLRVGSDILIANGSTLMEPGWLNFLQPSLDEDEKEEPEAKISELPEGTECLISETHLVKSATTPPKYYTDASLLRAMTNCSSMVKDPMLKKILRSTCGIGTEATRADIFKKLFIRKYVYKKGKQIRPTELGLAVIDFFPPKLKSIEQTAYWEQRLDEIAQRKISARDFLDEISKTTREIFESELPDINLDKVIIKCPNCGKQLIRRKSKNGMFWGCSGYPDCKTSFDDKRGKPDVKKSKKGKK